MSGNFWLDWLQLALSLFSCILLLWLGLTVLLNSERRTGSVLLITGTAFFGSIFFAAHTALLQIAGRVPAPSLDFWWKVGWLMLAALPFGWCVIVFWFAGYGDRQSPLHRYRIPLAALGAVAVGLLVALLLGLALPSFAHMLALHPVTMEGVMGLPWFLALYPLYMLACTALALAALRAGAAAPAAELGLARSRARPWVLATTALLAGVGLLVAWAIAWFQSLPRNGTVGLADLLAGAARFDLAVSALLALTIVLIGQALVHFEIFSGRTLPRRELRRHWNYALILASGYGIVVGGSLVYGLRPIYDLLLSAVLMATLFALTGWRTFTRQQAFVRRLQPFVASTHLYQQLTAQPGVQATGEVQGEMQGEVQGGSDVAADTFKALCQDVLNTRYAVLLAAGPLATLSPQPLTYPPGVRPPAPGEWLERIERGAALCAPLQLTQAPQAAWVVPLRGDGQFMGALLLGERNDRSLYTDEEIQVAKATGERLLDLRASAELALRLLKVQRQRLVESALLDRQTRRVLHDDVLPDLHTALLLLNQEMAGRPAGNGAGDMAGGGASNLAAAGDLLMSAHRRIAELLRSMPVRPALQAGGGLLHSLRQLLAGDFAGQFDCVVWDVAAEAETLAASLPPVTAEVVYYALREVIRNALRHGRGGDESRSLTLRIGVHAEDGLRIVVEDDGVGGDLAYDLNGSGAGQGLAVHTALLAVVGASMSVQASPAAGARAAVHLPLSACLAGSA